MLSGAHLFDASPRRVSARIAERITGLESAIPKGAQMRLRTSLVALCIVAFTATSQAWGPAGHKIVASIAFRRLSPEKQAKIVALLKKHPRYEDDFAGKMPDDLSEQLTNEWIMQQAAIWPDLARGL